MEYKEFTIVVPTFKTHVKVYASKSKKTLELWNNEILKKHKENKEDFRPIEAARSYDVYLDEEGFKCAAIVFNSKELSYGTIAHEVLHCASYILNYCDVYLNEETEEVYAYLIEYLTESIHLELKIK